MSSKRAIVELLTSAELVAVAQQLGLDGAEHDSHSALLEGMVASKGATLPKILAELPIDRLKELCRAVVADDSGRNRPTLIRRLTRTDSATRLFGLVARDARIAVIFRRGPSKQVRMLLWDLVTDAVTPGQWLSGRIYDERCGISPDGRLVVYFAGKFKTKLATFTAVSRPPYFTALALWPEGSTYGGGGFFEHNRKLILNYNCLIAELNNNATLPADFVVSHTGEYCKRHNRDQTAQANQGWILKSKGADGAPTPKMRFVYSPPWVCVKPHPTQAGVTLERSTLGMGEVNGPFTVYSYRLLETPPKPASASAGEALASDLGRLDWADWDHDGSLLFAEHGCLYRRALATRVAKTPVKLVAALGDQVFSNVLPPEEARKWP